MHTYVRLYTDLLLHAGLGDMHGHALDDGLDPSLSGYAVLVLLIAPHELADAPDVCMYVCMYIYREREREGEREREHTQIKMQVCKYPTHTHTQTHRHTYTGSYPQASSTMPACPGKLRRASTIKRGPLPLAMRFLLASFSARFLSAQLRTAALGSCGGLCWFSVIRRCLLVLHHVTGVLCIM